MNIAEKQKRVINITTDKPDLSPLRERNPVVEKIVIGESPTDASAKMLSIPTLPSFELDFKKLSHLYLWSTAGYERLPALPDTQQVLEIRNSCDLTSITKLPTTLHSLILEDCPQLKALPSLEGRRFAALVELCLVKCPRISQAWIHQLIQAAPNLRRLDLSHCPQIADLPVRLPNALDRLDLNDCASLRSVPDPLPLTLRRLGLRGACSIEHLPDFPRDLDYLDLALTESLTGLPSFPKITRAEDVSAVASRPRTLFLYRSGILEPPASEHGATAETNVAVETGDFFEDVELVGRGSVRRCKWLFLGNGSAGKTRLALNLNPKYINRKSTEGGHYCGSTHGVQFWPWPEFEARAAGQSTDASLSGEKKPVNLHLWDFGGQEIYHSTHRLFVSCGSVFIILWNPDQDGKQPPPENGYQDIWYPVRYWLDYIHMECPHTHPLITIVCAHQSKHWSLNDASANQKLKAKLANKLRQDIGDEYAKRFPLFVLDSETEQGVGEREELMSWLQKSVFKLVAAQGTAVPTHWEVAQNMVETWLPAPIADDSGAGVKQGEHAIHTRLTRPEFTQFFHEAIQSEIDTPDRGTTDFDRLRANYREGKFLSTRRLERTLRFLTHSGWLYWKEDLHQSRVIIDQRWALDIAYATLAREGTVRDKLVAASGRFTLQNLKDWCWKFEPLDEDDQKLLLSFMASAGVCFELREGYSSGERAFISPTHLPDSSDLVNQFHAEHVDQTSLTATSQQLHRGHWLAIVRDLCARYGVSGVFTENACLIRGDSNRWKQSDEEWSALLQFSLDDETKGLGGKIAISIAGAIPDDKLPSLERFVQSFLPGYDGKASDAVSEFDREYIGVNEKIPTVFFSYAWDPVGKQEYYEEPVNAVFNALKPFEGRAVRLLRDKVSMGPADYITEFITHAGSQDVDLMLVFTSEKYWRSWWCMMELCSLIKSLTKSTRGVDTNVLVIEHESGRKWTAGDVAKISDYWKTLELVEMEGETVPKDMPEQLLEQSWTRLVTRFKHVIAHDSIPLTSDSPQIRRLWSVEESAEIIEWVKQKLGLPTGGRP